MDPKMLELNSPRLNSVRIISSYIKSSIQSSSPSEFIPFVHERDNTGKLILSSSSVILSQPASPNPKKFQNSRKTKVKSIENVAFLTSKYKTSARVSKKANDFAPVGLYNPVAMFDIQSHNKSPVFKHKSYSERKKMMRSSSIDLLDLRDIYTKTMKKVPTVSMEKQLPRDPIKKTLENMDKITIPKVHLPDYLKKFNGLYHVSEFGKSKLFPLPKDTVEKTIVLKEKFSQHMLSLRNINNFYKEYGLTAKWKFE
jgi:hypothetical protein